MSNNESRAELEERRTAVIEKEKQIFNTVVKEAKEKGDINILHEDFYRNLQAMKIRIMQSDNPYKMGLIVAGKISDWLTTDIPFEDTIELDRAVEAIVRKPRFGT